jgi:hypothetical protein
VAASRCQVGQPHSLEDAGRLRTSTNARHGLQGKRCLIRH